MVRLVTREAERRPNGSRTVGRVAPRQHGEAQDEHGLVATPRADDEVAAMGASDRARERKPEAEARRGRARAAKERLEHAIDELVGELPAIGHRQLDDAAVARRAQLDGAAVAV